MYDLSLKTKSKMNCLFRYQSINTSNEFLSDDRGDNRVFWILVTAYDDKDKFLNRDDHENCEYISFNSYP